MEKLKSDRWPGPTSYNHHESKLFLNTCGVKFDMAKRQGPKKDASPGPIYNTIYAARKLRPRIPEIRFGKGPRLASMAKGSKMPGPGAYNLDHLDRMRLR